MSEPTDPPTHGTRDQLRAMAHPLRLQIVERIGRRGTARAADLASDLDVPANSISYHLRFLARGGVITEAPDAAHDRRDRVWRLTQQDFSAPPHATEEGANGASRAITLATFDWMRSAWIAALPSGGAQNSPNEDAAAEGLMFASTLRLSPNQAAEFFAKATDLLKGYKDLNRNADGTDQPGDPDSPTGANDYRVMFALVGDQNCTPITNRQSPSVQSPHDHA